MSSRMGGFKGVGVGVGVPFNKHEHDYVEDDYRECEICGETCDNEFEKLKVLDCSHESCGQRLYHQNCLNKNFKSGWNREGLNCYRRGCTGRITNQQTVPLPLAPQGRVLERKQLKMTRKEDIVVVPITAEQPRLPRVQKQERLEGNDGDKDNDDEDIVVVVQQRPSRVQFQQLQQLQSQQQVQQQGQQHQCQQQLAQQKDKDRVVITMKTQRGRGKNEVVGVRNMTNGIVRGRFESEEEPSSTDQGLKVQQVRREGGEGARKASDGMQQGKKHGHIILIENAWTSRSHLSSSLADRNPKQPPPLSSEEAFPPPTVTRSSENQKSSQNVNNLKQLEQNKQDSWSLMRSNSLQSAPMTNNPQIAKNQQPPKQLFCRPQPQVIPITSKPAETPFTCSPRSWQLQEPFVTQVPNQEVVQTQLPVQMVGVNPPQQRDSGYYMQACTPTPQYPIYVQTASVPQQFSGLPQLVVPAKQGVAQVPCQSLPLNGCVFTPCLEVIKFHRLYVAHKALMNIGYDVKTARAAVQIFGEDLQASLTWLKNGCQPLQVTEPVIINIDWEIQRMGELVQKGAQVGQVVETVKAANGDVVAASEMLFPQLYLQASPPLSPPFQTSPTLFADQTNPMTFNQEHGIEPEDRTGLFNCFDSFCMSDASLKSPLDVNASITSDDSFSDSNNFARGSRFMSFFRSINDLPALSSSLKRSQYQNVKTSNQNFNKDENVHYILNTFDDSNELTQPPSTQKESSLKNNEYGLPDSLYDESDFSKLHAVCEVVTKSVVS